ncbi:hybrid sensor histidine kinase/response regulator [Dyadobacter sediminis]|uniref:histidine kinase n=1 Tax=Dyadobacter sediminis TaxID=1493691 RepID=A0A5R9KFF7_9BACT|nr:hybrid sensor histidine kinase/response regulator [Dyadobacter sediminis]TLU94872.1 response regulator [Dyadobacter sediminis]GGB87231.1 histidine kinase [Dyadobacter sediminis]
MKVSLRAVLFFLVVSYCLQAQEKNRSFRHLTTNQGLSQNNVTSIQKDRRGFMWFGTQDGLNIYDGYKFTVYRNEPHNPGSLGHNYVHTIFEDSKGRLWIGTNYGGLSLYNPETDRFTNYTHKPGDDASISHNNVTSIAEDKNGNLWIGTGGGGLNYFDIKKRTFRHFIHHESEPSSLSDNFVIDVLVTSDGAVWAAMKKKGLEMLSSDGSRFTHYMYDPADPKSLSKNEINSIYEDAQHRFWIATEGGGLNLFNRSEGKFTAYQHDEADPQSISHNDVISLAQDKKGRLWIGTRNGGINILEKNGTFKKYAFDPAISSGLNNGSIYSLHCDNIGTMWIGTYSGGVNVMDYEPQKFNLYRSNPSRKNGLNNDNILTVTEDSDGKLWLGTDGGGINVWDRKTDRFTHYTHNPLQAESIASNFIMSLYEDKDKKMWIGNYKGGLSIFNREKGTFLNLNEDSSIRDVIPSNINSMIEGSNGFIWIGTSAGLIRYDKKARTYIVYNSNAVKHGHINNDIIKSLCIDRKGNLWIGTEGGGLNLFNEKQNTFTHYANNEDDENSISNNLVNCIYEDKKGNLWIGTSNGLNLFNPKTGNFRSYRQKDGLPNNVIQGITEDSRGTLWISTNYGISNFNPGTRTFRNFDNSDGLQGTSFNRMSVYKNQEGYIFFGGQNGFNFFHPDSIAYNNYIPPVYITDFQIFNKSVTLHDAESPLKKHITATQEITVSYKDLMLSFEFTALNYTISRKNKYAYKLEGFDKDWIFPGTTRRATYTNLDPGDYVFRVKASNNDGIWNETGTSVRLHIIPPFWQTWWFQGVMLLLVAALIIGIYHSRMEGVKKQKLELLSQVQARTKEVIRQKQVLEEQAENLHKLNSDLQKKHIEEQLAREEAERANQAKSVFLATMSHEIRTPMNGILGMAALLSQTAMNEEQEEYAETIMSCGDGLLTVINDILDFSKIESGNMELENKPFDLHECIEEVLGIFSGKASDLGLDLVYQIAPDVPGQIVGDNLRLRQVLINLVGNAVKFTQQGEILVSVQNAGMKDDGMIELKFLVQDTGIGIPQDKLDLLFKAFSQVDSSHTRKYGGTGLGLVISQRLVQLMGGHIHAESWDGKGTDFYFSIHTRASEQKLPQSADNEAHDIEGKLVLVVDDNKTNLRIIESQLRYWKLVPVLAASGQAALDRLDQYKNIELVITDQHMPEMNGLELGEKIKSRFPQLPIVLLSSVGDVVRKNNSDIFRSILTKPVKHQKLVKVIRNELSQRSGAIQPDIASKSQLSNNFAADFPLTILIAEDNPINEKLFVTVLRKLGYTAQVVHNGREALETVQRQTFDLIFMDVQMPEMDGLEAASLIRKLEIKQPFIVAVTANAMPEDREICINAGMDDYISKPLRYDDVKASLQSAFNTKKPLYK